MASLVFVRPRVGFRVNLDVADFVDALRGGYALPHFSDEQFDLVYDAVLRERQRRYGEVKEG